MILNLNPRTLPSRKGDHRFGYPSYRNELLIN